MTRRDWRKARLRDAVGRQLREPRSGRARVSRAPDGATFSENQRWIAELFSELDSERQRQQEAAGRPAVTEPAGPNLAGIATPRAGPDATEHGGARGPAAEETLRGPRQRRANLGGLRQGWADSRKAETPREHRGA